MSAGCINQTYGTPAASRTLMPALEERCTIQLCYRSVVSVAGVEPAKPASLVQYLCQFGYTDLSKWSPARESNPHHPHFKCGSYAISDTGRKWCPHPDSNREQDASETPAYALSAIETSGAAGRKCLSNAPLPDAHEGCLFLREHL